MRKGIFFFLLILISNVYSQQINYRLSMPKPQNHYFEVELIISDWNKDSLILEMPVWAPGSYLVRDFPKNVNQVKASDKNGNNLEAFKVSKNKWLVRTKKVKDKTG